MGWKSWNDRLSLVLLVGIPGLWLVQALSGRELPAEAIGATIAVWTLVAQYYFRRHPPTGGGGP